MRVLVTGGAGYVGAHTAKALAEAGQEPVVYDDLSNGRREAARWGPLIVGDIRDSERLSRALKKHRIEAVIHMAARIEVGALQRDPAPGYSVNVEGTLSLLRAMRAAGVATIVQSSTAAVYGQPRTTPIGEDHPLAPVNAYGATKLVVEQALRWYGEAYGLHWAALRYFNACGADPVGEIGECHEPESHLIPLALFAGLGRGPALTVFGDDYPTPDGTAIRDYVHVSDLAEAHVRALNHLKAGSTALIANLGTGQGYSVREVLAAAEAALGLPIPHRIAGRRAGDAAELVADPARARDRLGWQARLSDLPTIMETALRWYRSGGR